MPNPTGPSLLETYKEVHRILTCRGFQPKYHRLDNEISKVFEDYLYLVNADFHLTPAGSH